MALTMLSSDSAGQVCFDAVFKTSHASNVTLTTQPVQSGANIADHAYVEPDAVTLEIGMTDAAIDAEENHSVNMYALLRSIMEQREPVSLYTRLKSYTDMMIVAMSVDDDYTTSTALRASIMLQQLIMVDVATVSVQKTVSSSRSNSNNNNKKEEQKQEEQQQKTSGLWDIVNGLFNSSKQATESEETKSTTKVSGSWKEKANSFLGINLFSIH